MVQICRQNIFAISFAILALVALGCPLGAESARIKRQSGSDSGSASGNLNLTSIISALDLTPYLQNATTQISQAVANLTSALESQTPAIQQAAQQALQGLSNSTGDLASNLQQFLTNFENQLNATGTTVSSNLTNAINTLQTFYNQSAPALQELVNAVGGNITDAAQTLQSDIAALSTFLQSGLQNLTMFTGSQVQKNIATLQNLLNNGTLDQALASLVTDFNGQAVTFQEAFNALQSQVGTSFPSVLNSVQNGIQSFATFFFSFFQSFFQSVTLLVSPN